MNQNSNYIYKLVGLFQHNHSNSSKKYFEHVAIKNQVLTAVASKKHRSSVECQTV